jgi:hypothetical protein
MTNIFGTPKKVSRKTELFNAGIAALEKEGWTVERIPKVGKSSIRRIVKGHESKVVTIRTSQDTYIAFPRDDEAEEWATLAMADMVVAASIDDRENPRFAQIHLIDGDEMRDRFDRGYKARLDAGHSIPSGRGMWLSLYEEEQNDIPSLVGAGAGLDNPPISRVPLEKERDQTLAEPLKSAPSAHVATSSAQLSISDAREQLAKTFGVDPSHVKISIEV